MARRSVLGGWVLRGLACLVATGCAACVSPLDRGWVRVRTTHLEIASASSKTRTLELARDLVAFRDLVAAVTSLKETAPRIPTRVFVLEPESWSQLGIDAEGFFRPGLRMNAMVMARHAWTRDADERYTLLHEYVHFLEANQQQRSYPPWFSEGWADLLGNARIEEDVVTLGRMHPSRVEWMLRPYWLDMSAVLAARAYPSGAEAKARFYAQSLGLLHYLQLGRGDIGRFGPEAARYLGLVDAGRPVDAAFEEAFGFPVDEIQRRVRDYLRDGVTLLKIPRKNLPPPPEPQVERLEPAEVAASLGRLMLHCDRPRAARGWFAQALMRDPARTRARCGLGAALDRSGEWEEADAQLRRCLAEAPEAPEAHLDRGNHFYARALAEPGSPRRDDWIRRAREHYAESLRLDPEGIEALMQMGSTHLVPRGGADAETALPPLARAHERLPASVGIRIRLALALARLGRREEAEALLAGVGVVGAHRVPVEGLEGELLGELREALGGLPGPLGRGGER